VQLTESGENKAPADKAKAVYFSFLLFGIGVLMPINVILACLDFYAQTVSKHTLV
jgi:hypothetical protein